MPKLDRCRFTSTGQLEHIWKIHLGFVAFLLKGCMQTCATRQGMSTHTATQHCCTSACISRAYETSFGKNFAVPAVLAHHM